MSQPPIIADRAEFVDALQALRNGHLLIRVHEHSGGCVLDGGIVYHSFQTLLDYGLIGEVDNPGGFPTVRYYRMTPQGRQFADKACSTWRQRPLLERLAVRMAG